MDWIIIKTEDGFINVKHGSYKLSEHRDLNTHKFTNFCLSFKPKGRLEKHICEIKINDITKALIEAERIISKIKSN